MPLNVNADSASFDETNGRAVYKGNVELTQGNLRIQADQLTAILVDGAVTEMQAQGNPAVFIDVPSEAQGQVEGVGRSIAWTLTDQTMVIEGDAKLTQSTNVVSGERVVYQQDLGTLEATGDRSERVQMTLTPATQ